MTEKLFKAVKAGRIEYIQRFLDKKGDIDVLSDSEQTLLIYACRKDRIDVMQLLIGAKAKLEMADKTDKTALTYAAQSGSVKGMRLLLDAQANPNSPASRYRPLDVAANARSSEKVKILLEARACVQVWRERFRYETSLSLAKRRGRTNLTQFLLDTKAAPTDRDLMTMYEACAKGRVAVAQRLINEGFPPIVSPNTWTPLQLATKHGYTAIAEMLIAARSDVNYKSWNGMTPLHYAVMNRDAKCTLALLQAGALVSPPHHDMLPLLYAIEYGYEDMVHLLLAFKADVNTKTENCVNALIYAIVCHRSSIAKTLIRLNADVCAPDASFRPPLTYAVEYRNTDIAKLLLSAKADVDMCDHRHSTHDDHILTVESKWTLQPAYLGSGSPLICAAAAGNVDMVQLLLTAHATVDKPNDVGNTPLLWAAMNGHVHVARMLMDAKASVHDASGKIASLICAARGNAVADENPAVAERDEGKDDDEDQGDNEDQVQDQDQDEDEDDVDPSPSSVSSAYITALRLLVEANAPVDACGDTGLTPLMVSTECADTTAALLEMGASVYDVDKDNKTALCWAAHHGDLAAMQALIDARASISHRANDGMNVLTRATAMRRHEVMQALIDAKADVNVNWPKRLHEGFGHKEDRSPLMWAICNGDEGATRLLLAAKASLKHEAKRGQSPLRDAISNKHEQILKILLDANPDISATSEALDNLIFAAKTNQVALMKILIEAKVPLEPTFSSAGSDPKMSPLIEAIVHYNTAAVRVLLDAKAAVDGLYASKRGPPKDLLTYVLDFVDRHQKPSVGKVRQYLSAETKEKITPLVKLLLEANAYVSADTFLHRRWHTLQLMFNYEIAIDVDDRNFGPGNGATLLHELVSLGSSDATAALIKRNASIDAQDDVGQTALMRAVSAADVNVDVVKLLITMKASLDVRDNRGNTALMRSMLGARSESSLKAVRLLIEAKASMDLSAEDGDTPLLCAIRREQDQAAMMLVEAKANVNAKAADGATPLTNAIRQNRPLELIKSLLGAKASVHEQDNNGYTAWLYAAESTSPSSRMICQLLDEAAAQGAAGSSDTPMVKTENLSESVSESASESVSPPAKKFRKKR